MTNPSVLGDICSLQGGYAFKSKDFSEFGVPVVKIADVTGGSSMDYSRMQCVSQDIAVKALRFKTEVGDTLISMTGANVGKATRVWSWDPEAVINQRVGRFVPQYPDRYSKDFIHYLVTSYEAYEFFKNTAYGSAQPNISGKQIESLPIPDLSADEAMQIGSILGALDDKIDLNRRMAATLEEMARALYRSWFVDFDPVKAKAEGLAPAFMEEATAAYFPDRFGDDGLPEGWPRGRLSDVAINPRTGVKPEQIDPSTPYIGLEHMPRRSIRLGDWGTAEDVGSQKSAMRRGDFLFGKLRPYFHKVGISPVDGICSTDIIVVRPKAPEWASFVLSVISSDDFVEHTNASSSGTRMPRTSWGEMSRYEVVIPPAPVAAAFEAALSSMRDRIVAGVHEARNLAEFRDALLPKLMSGEIRVGTIENQIEAVA